MPTKKWTEEEEEFLRDNFMDMSNADLAEKFGITKNAIQKKLARMGLKRSETKQESQSDETSGAKIVEEKKREMSKAESHFSLGNKFYYEERNYEKAIEEYQKVAEEETDQLIKLKARYWMAESYLKLQKKDEAVEVLKELAKDYKDHYLGDSAMRRLKTLSEYIVPDK
jgi:TolA-binding protein